MGGRGIVLFDGLLLRGLLYGIVTKEGKCVRLNPVYGTDIVVHRVPRGANA